MPWPKLSRKRDRSSPRAQKNHGYAFVHFATDCGADLFQRRVADFAAGFLGPLLGENVAEMWASVAVLQGLTNNLVNLTATSQGRKARRRTDRMDTCVVLRLDGQFVEIPKVALMKLQLR
jgi:hypothetical protein